MTTNDGQQEHPFVVSWQERAALIVTPSDLAFAIAEVARVPKTSQRRLAAVTVLSALFGFRWYDVALAQENRRVDEQPQGWLTIATDKGYLKIKTKDVESVRKFATAATDDLAGVLPSRIIGLTKSWLGICDLIELAKRQENPRIIE